MKLNVVLVGTTKLQVDVLKMPSLGGSGPSAPGIPTDRTLESEHVKIHGLLHACHGKLD